MTMLAAAMPPVPSAADLFVGAALPIEPFISVGGSIIVAMIGGFFTVYTAVERQKSKAAAEKAEAEKKAAEAKAKADAERDEKIDQILNQVANTHDSNLRDDLDEKFAELRDQIRAGDARTHKRIDGLNDRLDRHIDNRA